jgi:hypothetical protein
VVLQQVILPSGQFVCQDMSLQQVLKEHQVNSQYSRAVVIIYPILLLMTSMTQKLYLQLLSASTIHPRPLITPCPFFCILGDATCDLIAVAKLALVIAQLNGTDRHVASQLMFPC